MVDVDKEFPSSFVIAGEDVKSGDTIKFVDAGRTEESPQFGKNQLLFTVEIPGGEEKTISVNGASRKALKEVWGNDTENWRGKSAAVTVTRQNVAGTMRNVMYLEPAEGASVKAPKKEEEGK